MTELNLKKAMIELSKIASDKCCCNKFIICDNCGEQSCACSDLCTCEDWKNWKAEIGIIKKL